MNSSGAVVPLKGSPSIDVSKLQAFEAAIAGAVVVAKKHRITDTATRGGAAEHRSNLKSLEKQLQASYDQHVKPFGDLVRQAQAIAKALKDTLGEGLRAIDAEISRDFREREAAQRAEAARLERERQEKERLAQEERDREAKAAADKAAAEALKAGMTETDAKEVGELFAQDVAAEPLPPVLQVAPPPPPAKTIASVTGASAAVRKEWDFTLHDIGALATAYPDTVDVKRKPVLDLLRALEKDGATEEALASAIPGVRAFKRVSVAS